MVRFGEPLALAGLALAVGFAFLFRGRGLGRAVTVLFLVLALAEPEISLRESRELFFFLVDRSASVPGALDPIYRELLPALRARDAEVGIISFAREPLLVRLPSGQPPEELPRGFQALDPNGTDIASAIDLAVGLVPEGRSAQLILLSDGRSTKGDPLAAAARARLRGIRVSAIPVGTDDPLIVRVLQGPEEMPPGTATFTAVLSSRAALSASLVWKLNGREVRRESVSFSPGEHRLTLELELPSPGTYVVSLEVTVSGDPFPENDRAATVVHVGEGARVLVVGNGPSALKELLTESGISFRQVPFLTEFDLWDVDLVILDDYPLGYINPLLLEHLRAFAEGGGGLLAILGRAAVEGYLGEVEEILPVGFSAPEVLREPSAALVFVLDKSSSMAGRAGALRKIDILKEAVAAAVETVYEEDYLGALAFDRNVHWLVRPAPAVTARDTLYQALKGLSPSGGTDLYPAVEAAITALTEVQARVRHVIIVSDGKTVREKDFASLSRRIAQEGLGVTAIAIGTDPDLEILGMLARAGDGDLVLVPDLKSLTQVLLRETQRALRPRFLEGNFPIKRGEATLAHEIPTPPPLRGYTLTFPKPLAQKVLETQGGDPVFSVWRMGLGWVGALTTDLSGVWSRSWLEWEGFPDFFGKILKAVWPQRGHIRLAWEREGDLVRITAEVEEGGSWVNGLRLRGKLVGEDQEEVLVFHQTAPGRYEATVPLPIFGAYSVAVHDVEGRYGGNLALAIPYPPEYADIGVDRASLSRLVEAGGGELLEDELIPPPAGGGRWWFPLRRVFLLLAGLAFLADLAWRKLSP